MSDYFRQLTPREYIVKEIDETLKDIKNNMIAIKCSFACLTLAGVSGIIGPFVNENYPSVVSRAGLTLSALMFHNFFFNDRLLKIKASHLFLLSIIEKFKIPVTMDREYVVEQIETLENKDQNLQLVIGAVMSLSLLAAILAELSNPKIPFLLAVSCYPILVVLLGIYGKKYNSWIKVVEEKENLKIDLQYDNLQRTRKRGNENEKQN